MSHLVKNAASRTQFVKSAHGNVYRITSVEMRHKGVTCACCQDGASYRHGFHVQKLNSHGAFDLCPMHMVEWLVSEGCILTDAQ